jgi:YHS domain-containing protein
MAWSSPSRRHREVADADRDEQGRRPEARDPVCGMTVSVDAPHRISLGARDVLFCSRGRMESFREVRGVPGVDVSRGQR